MGKPWLMDERGGIYPTQPDFPELKNFPFLWQQVEYVLSGGTTHYMFLVLAAQQYLK